MSEHVDVVVVGMGPGGEVVAGRLLDAGRRVAVVEQELVGGECAYWACIPSKTLLRPPEADNGVRRAAGVAGGGLDWQSARSYRDFMIRELDDSKQVSGYAAQGALVLKDRAVITAPSTVRAGERTITAEHLVIATGSQASVPPIEGLDEVDAWTNREVYTADQLPGRAVVIGGSAVGVETAQFLVRFGTQVTVLQRSDRLLSREEEPVGELAERHLREAGVDVRTGVSPVRARRSDGNAVVDLDDGSSVTGDVIMLATGRRPRTEGLGLEEAAVTLGDGGQVVVDEHCRAADGVWAVGDVTGIMPFTHVAKYQGRIVAEAILGRARPARYDGIPRVVFGDPEVAAVGLTLEQARQRRMQTRAARIVLGEQLARPWTYEMEPRGEMGLLLDTDRDVLVGAWAVAPQAGEWIHQAALAIRTGLPREVLLDQVAQFPTYSEAYLTALEQLGD